METWDELISERKAITQIASILNVSQDYLIYQTNFLKAVTLDNKFLAKKALHEAKERLKELQ